MLEVKPYQKQIYNVHLSFPYVQKLHFLLGSNERYTVDIKHEFRLQNNHHYLLALRTKSNYLEDKF
jgi:hypothetical protein